MGQNHSKFATFDQAVQSDTSCPWVDMILPNTPLTFEEAENNIWYFVSKEHIEQDIEQSVPGKIFQILTFVSKQQTLQCRTN